MFGPADGPESEPTFMRAARALQEELQRAMSSYDRASNAQFTDMVVTAERIAWQVFSFQVLLAAAADDHFTGQAGDGTLGGEYGCATSREYLQRCTLASRYEVGARIRLGKKLRPEASLAGGDDSPPLPYLAVATRAGAISPQNAKLVAATLNKVSWERAEIRDKAERQLVEAATGIDLGAGSLEEIASREKQAEADGGAHLNLLKKYADQGLLDPLPSPSSQAALDTHLDETDADSGEKASPALAQDADSLKVMAQEWSQGLSRDGTLLDDQDALAKRELHFGPLTGGLIPVRGRLLPETAASLLNASDAINSPRLQNHNGLDNAKNDTENSQSQVPEDGALSPEKPDIERRTASQKRHDALAMIVNMAAAASEMPSHGGAPVTVLVETTQEALETGGTGWLHGPGNNKTLLTTQALHHATCSGSIQHYAKNADGRLVALGTKQRIFNANQRKAIIARDGGCLIPGCATPPAWCEIHHVLPHSEGGETHTDNGVALCWYHHRTLSSNGWEIRMNKGVPEVKAPPWIDPNQKWRDPRRPTAIPENQKLFFWNAWGNECHGPDDPDGPTPPGSPPTQKHSGSRPNPWAA